MSILSDLWEHGQRPQMSISRLCVISSKCKYMLLTHHLSSRFCLASESQTFTRSWTLYDKHRSNDELQTIDMIIIVSARRNYELHMNLNYVILLNTNMVEYDRSVNNKLWYCTGSIIYINIILLIIRIHKVLIIT